MQKAPASIFGRNPNAPLVFFTEIDKFERFNPLMPGGNKKAHIIKLGGNKKVTHI